MIVGGTGGGAGDQGSAPGPTATGPNGSYLPFIATLASLLLALGVGVWIGRGQEAPAASAAPIMVPAAAAAAAPAATTPADDAAATDDSAAKDDTAKDDSAAEDAGSTATNPDIKKLEQLSPEEYQKQAQKLPKEVGTGGTPPPKDNKPAGGGSEFESFE